MITIPETLQEIFDIVALHLMTQKEKSRNAFLCMYRSPDGLKCAAGALIKDEEYTEDLEENGWHSLVADGRAPEAHAAEIRKLQLIHDMSCSNEWEDELIAFGRAYNLTLPECLR